LEIAYLDTHIIVALFKGNSSYFSTNAVKTINENNLYFASISKLELQLFFEIGRLQYAPGIILNELSKNIGLCEGIYSYTEVTDKSLEINFTRDPFDRMIVAESAIDSNPLITKDENILQNYTNAIW
jgi:PIN domain nuclease of toxin-antitoxin system